MIDSHTHLHVCKPDDAELVAAAQRAGVDRKLTVGTKGVTSRGTRPYSPAMFDRPPPKTMMSGSSTLMMLASARPRRAS